MTEKIKNYVGVALVVALLLVGYSAWNYVSSYSKSIQPSSFRQFSVNGEGKVVAIPDVAEFTFGIVTEGGTDLAKLQRDNTEKSNKAITFLKTNGVEEKDIKTEGYNVSPRYENYNCYPTPYGDYDYGVVEPARACPPAKIVGYNISQTVAVKIRKFDTIGAVLTGIVSAGANSVSQLSFAIDDQTEVQNRARAEAIGKAIAKAKGIARAAGFRVGRLLAIDEGFSPVPYYRAGGFATLEAKSADAGAPPEIEPGSQDVVVNVTLTYEIE